jgi:hypothetical protein
MNFNIDVLRLMRHESHPRLQFTLQMTGNTSEPSDPEAIPALSVIPSMNTLSWELSTSTDYRSEVEALVDFSQFVVHPACGQIQVSPLFDGNAFRGGVVVKDVQVPPPRSNHRVTADLHLKEMLWERDITGFYKVSAVFNHALGAEYTYQVVSYSLEVNPLGQSYIVYYVERVMHSPGDLFYLPGMQIAMSPYSINNRLNMILWDRTDQPTVDWTCPLDHFCEIYFAP